MVMSKKRKDKSVSRGCGPSISADFAKFLAQADGSGVSRSRATSVGVSTTKFTGLRNSHCSDDRKHEMPSGSVDLGYAYYLRINAMAAALLDLDAFAQSIGLTRHDGEDSDDLASRCHYRIDDLMREHAKRARDHRLIELMDMHDTIERLVP